MYRLVGKGYCQDIAVSVVRLGRKDNLKVLFDQLIGFARTRRSVINGKGRSGFGHMRRIYAQALAPMAAGILLWRGNAQKI